MSIPDFQTILRPLLAAHEDGREHRNRDLVAHLGDLFGLTDEERRVMLPSGGARLFDNRVGWAKTHVMQAGLLACPRRAFSVITQRGRDVLRTNPERVDLQVLKQFEDYREFRERQRPSEDPQDQTEPADTQTPEETLENAYQDVRRQVEAELLRQLMDSPPDFMERVVVDLVVRMGYGGSRKDAG